MKLLTQLQKNMITQLVCFQQPRNEYRQADLSMIKTMLKDENVYLGGHGDDIHQYNGATKGGDFLLDGSEAEFSADIEKMNQKFEDDLDLSPNAFAYPFGYGRDETDAILKSNGIEYIFTLSAGLTNQTTAQEYIPRNVVTPETFKFFKEILNN